MTIEITEFIAKAPKIDAVLLTEENIEEVALWAGAKAYSVTRFLNSDRNPMVHLYRDHRADHYAGSIGTLPIGDYLVRRPAQVTEDLEDRKEYFFSVTKKELNEFVNQQREKGEIDVSAPPYDR